MNLENKGGKMKITLLAAFLALVGMVQAAKVSSVSVKMSDGTDLNTGDVTARCQVKVGDEFDPEQCARDVRALRDAGEYDNIVLKAEHGAKGIDITYVVTPKLRFQGPLNVNGNDYWSVSKITSLSELKDGYPYGEADFEAAAGRIKRAYQKKFFPDVKVSYRLEPIQDFPGAVHVTMDIEEGARKKIHAFVFRGQNTVFEKYSWWDPEGWLKDDAYPLRASFDDYPWWNPWGWFSDAPATDQDFAEARDKVAAYYRDRGFLDVKVSLPEEEVLPNGEVDRVFTIEEGVRYKVGRMSVVGTKQYPADAVLAANKALATGDIAGAAAMAEAAHQMEVFCGSGEKPLADTHVTVRQMPSGANPEVIDLEFAVEEGVPVVINRVLIRGNDYTKDKVLRREISLSPGDPMLADKAERSKRRLENLRYFDRVQYYLEKVDGGEAKDGKPEMRDLVYEVSEHSTGNFSVGIGASSIDSVYGMIELREHNFDLFKPWRFRGAGQKGRISAMVGPRVQNYEASVTEPYLFDRLLELTVGGYSRWSGTHDEYDVIRTGLFGDLSYPVKFWPTARTTGRLGFYLAAEYISMDDVENSVWYNPKTGDEEWRAFKEEERKYSDNWEIPFQIYWRDDTTDKVFFPTRGHRTKIYGQVTAGDNDYWRVGFDYRQYFTVVKKYGHVFAFRLHGDTLDAFSGNVPIYDRLFLGGPYDIRGFDKYEISPHIWRRAGKQGGYASWGGQTAWFAKVEYVIPVIKYLSIALFTDLGSVGADEFDFETDNFCWTIGLGLRLNIESFPIRLDFATPIVDPDDDVDEQVFSFTIGRDF